MARNCGPGKTCGMNLGLFNPFFTGNYANPYSYRGAGEALLLLEDGSDLLMEDGSFFLLE